MHLNWYQSGLTLQSTQLVTPTINTAANVGGSWVAASTWTLPAFTMGGTISTGGQKFIGAFLVELGTDGTAAMMTVQGEHAHTGTAVYGLSFGMTIPSTATASGYNFRSVVFTKNASFTLPDLQHFRAEETIKGASSTITSVSGFYAGNAIAAGTYNYAFNSNFSAASNKWALYLSGTAANYMNGELGIKANADTSNTITIGTPSSTGTELMGAEYSISAPSTATSGVYGHSGSLATAAAAFTCNIVAHYNAQTTTKGAGSTINGVFGFRAANGIASGTYNYGFYSDINSATTTYQLYMSGTALNFMKGGVILDTTAAPTVSASQFGLGVTTQTTVGAAGGASAIPASPTKYWIVNEGGTDYVIPLFAKT